LIIPAKKLTLITIRESERQVVRRLGELGVVHLKRMSEEEAKRLREAELGRSRELEETCVKLVEVWHALFKAGFEGERGSYRRYIEVKDRLNRLHAKRAEASHLRKILIGVKSLGEEELPTLGLTEELFSTLIIVPRDEVSKLVGRLRRLGAVVRHAKISEDEVLVHVIGLREKVKEVHEVISETYHQEVSLPDDLPRNCGEALSLLELKLSKLNEEIAKLEKEMGRLKEELIWLVGDDGSSLTLLKKLKGEVLKLRGELSIEESEGGGEEVGLEEAEKLLKEIAESYNSIRSKLDWVRRESDRLRKLRSFLKDLVEVDFKPPEIREYENIDLFMGLVGGDKLEDIRRAVSGKPIALDAVMLRDGRALVSIACLKDYSGKLLDLLRSIGFEDLTPLLRELPSDLHEAWRRTAERLEELRAEERRLLEELERLRRRAAPKLIAIYKSLDLNLRIEEALIGSLRTEALRIIQGWVPSDRMGWLAEKLDEIQERAGGVIAYRFESPRPDEKVPTLLKNPRLFKVFEPLVALYGWPGYGEIDPTVISGILWTIMFGVMFPDFGQGIVIIGLGLFFAYVFKGRFLGMNSKKIGRLMIGLGLSASLFGLLVGEFFLTEVQPLFPGLRAGWLEDPGGVIWLIKVAIFFGMAQILLAMSLSTLRELRGGKLLDAVLSHHGAAGVIAFVGFILTAFHFLGITVIPGALEFPELGMGALTSWPFSLMIAGFAMMILRPFLAREPLSLSLGNLLELVIAFLANTFSYARIAGFAIVHAALAMVVHRMMHANPLMGIGVGLIFLNLFALSIELLVCVIQALRLLYYEFYSKFYEGSGMPYTPWRIR